MPTASDKFDPYREALVVESDTIWAEDAAEAVCDPARRAEIESQLHAQPAQATMLHYLRLYTGFCRRIIVTLEDLRRLGVVGPDATSTGETSRSA